MRPASSQLYRIFHAPRREPPAPSPSSREHTRARKHAAQSSLRAASQQSCAKPGSASTIPRLSSPACALRGGVARQGRPHGTDSGRGTRRWACYRARRVPRAVSSIASWALKMNTGPPASTTWTVQKSKSTGRCYFFNTATGESSYERPPGCPLELPPSAPGAAFGGASSSASARREGSAGQPRAQGPRSAHGAPPASAAAAAGGARQAKRPRSVSVSSVPEVPAAACKPASKPSSGGGGLLDSLLSAVGPASKAPRRELTMVQIREWAASRRQGRARPAGLGWPSAPGIVLIRGWSHQLRRAASACLPGLFCGALAKPRAGCRCCVAPQRSAERRRSAGGCLLSLRKCAPRQLRSARSSCRMPAPAATGSSLRPSSGGTCSESAGARNRGASGRVVPMQR